MVDARGASKGSGLFDLECDFACEFLNHGDNVRCNYFALKSRLSQPLANPKKPPRHHQRGMTPLMLPRMLRRFKGSLESASR